MYGNLFSFLLLLITLMKCAPVELQTMRYSYNSSDLSYLSNGIQFPVPASELHNPKIVEDSNQIDETGSEMQWLAQLYDHMKWSQNSGKTIQRILQNSTKCQKDITKYIVELVNGTSWAAKMYDASGRYSGQFFFGNDYWLGSQTLCNEVENSYNEPSPPFNVRFYVAKVRININRNLTPVTRQLNVGQCLPASCTLYDVRLIMAHQDVRIGTSLNIVGIRPVPGDYSVFTDTKFHIIGGLTLVLVAIILIASIVEIITTNKKNRLKDSTVSIENNNHVIANNNNNNNNTSNGMYAEKMDFKEEEKQSLALKILLCFSAINNGVKILDVGPVSLDSIRCVHGLRFFSIAWIILVHTYLELFSVADNKNLRIITERTFMYQTISNATFSVDTFFFISGLLVTITYFRTMDKKKKSNRTGKKVEKSKTCAFFQNNSFVKLLMLILYRFLRLTPPYLLVLGVNEIILRYLHSYSVFSPAIVDHISCSSVWWRNALYINNFYPQTEFCMLWSWYISNDTQFYIIAVTLLVLAVQNEKYLRFAGAVLGIFMVASWITTFTIAMKYEYVARVEEPFALFDQLYDKPWLRIGPYLIGMFAGYILFKVNTKVEMKPLIVVLGWILSISCLASLVYGLGRNGLVAPASAFYAALGHTAWGLSLGWITIACCSGYGGPLNSLFSFKLFLPLSRLTYCAYLVHPVVMCYTSFLLDGPLHLAQLFLVVIYFGNVISSFLVAFFVSLIFEAPVVNLLKIIF